MLTAVDVLHPRWLLQPGVLWPELRLADAKKLVAALLGQAYTQTDEDGVPSERRDRASRWYTAYLAWKGRLETMSSLPAGITVRDEGASQYTDAQRTDVRRFMQEALDQYALVVAGEVDEPGAQYGAIRSLRPV